jgi:hypothetical protein
LEWHFGLLLQLPRLGQRQYFHSVPFQQSAGSCRHRRNNLTVVAAMAASAGIVAPGMSVQVSIGQRKAPHEATNPMRRCACERKLTQSVLGC